MPYLFELPTTGAISLDSVCVDTNNTYTARLGEASNARANVRGTLKDTKRAGDERDYLRVIKVLDEYLPHLYAIIQCLAAEYLQLSSEPIFSWRSTLSDHVLNASPRLDFPEFDSDLHFTLLTYGFALANFASSAVTSLGYYEKEMYSTEEERKACDDRLHSAVAFLCRASGVFSHVGDNNVVQLTRNGTPYSGPRVPEMSQNVLSALAKMTIADAQLLAIRKLLAKASHDSTLSPGSPLPKTHPSPGLLAKLYLFSFESYTSALTLVRSSSTKSIALASLRKSGSSASSTTQSYGDVAASLRKYLVDEAPLAGALAHKWLGIEAGEAGRSGEAIAYLSWAGEELEGLKEVKLKSLLSNNDKRTKEMESSRKDRLLDELKLVRSFLDNYTKENNTVNFQPVLDRKALLSLIPSGRAAVVPKKFIPPTPAFGLPNPESALGQADASVSASPSSNPSNYAGAGSYF
ncbi:hypothetical protein DL93DRAFT_1263495 [Clavulina sp. PMI_390]|nr:hypothetical protein DL93DRAFT_1263495 [Clavulina sp. PMI_390]